MRVSALLAGATLLATPLPWLAELWAHDAIATALARCGDGSAACGGLGSLSLDAGGLRLHGASKVARGVSIAADAVEVRPTWNGIEVHVLGLAIARAEATSADAARKRDDEFDGAAEPPPAPRIDTRGIPVRVVARGAHAIERRGVALQIHDPVLEIAADGSLHASFDADVRRGSIWAASAGRLRAQPTAGFETWAVGGRVVVADGDPLRLGATVSRTRIELELAQDDRGSLRIEASPEPLRATVEANGFRPAVLGELAAGASTGLAWDLREAVFDGAITVTRDDDWAVDIPTLLVAGAVVEHAALAREPVAIGSLLVAGRASARDSTNFAAELAAEHDGVSLQIDARRDAASLEVAARMPSTPCQALIDGMPNGVVGALRGSRLEGELEAELDLQVRFAELPAWEQRLALDPEDPGPAPGRLAIHFPFLEQCRMVGDPGDVDFAALRGPYRHEFIDGTGQRRSRVMAPGAPGFMPLWRVALVGEAFIALEDTGFREHDGFDRAQLHNALWHNFRVGGISRGASTISQQTARNLFLGIDRSIARKLQEALLTARLEAELSKSRILELYLNVIELGPGVHGVEDAAQYHFGKSAAQLGTVQAIHLAMLAPAPHRYSERFRGGQVDAAWKAEIREHVKRLWFHGVITEEEMLFASWDDLDLVPR